MKREAQQTACQNMPPKPYKTQPGTSPNPPKSRPGASLGAKMHPTGASDQPRDAKERPRSAQEAPKRRPRGTKSRPRVAKSRPSDAQEAPESAPDPSKMEPDEPQDEFLARSLWEALFDRLLERFCVVVCLVRNKRDVLTTKEKRVFFLGFCVSAASAQCKRARKQQL